MILFSYSGANAAPVTVDFEGFADGTPLTTQIPGLTFSNATILTAGISLNEFEFPPHSGLNVVFDDGGPMVIVFSTPVSRFSGYFTYLSPLTLTGFDAINTPLPSVTSAFDSNLALSGDPGSSPNERLEIALGSGLSRVIIAGDPFGASFTLDDVRLSPVPEPSSGTLFLTAVGAVFFLRRQTPKNQ